jgi:hypothetical protein
VYVKCDSCYLASSLFIYGFTYSGVMIACDEVKLVELRHRYHQEVWVKLIGGLRFDEHDLVAPLGQTCKKQLNVNS